MSRDPFRGRPNRRMDAGVTMPPPVPSLQEDVLFGSKAIGCRESLTFASAYFLSFSYAVEKMDCSSVEKFVITASCPNNDSQR